MPATTSVSPSGNQDIDGLLYNRKWAVSSFTFSFPTSASFYESGSAPSGETTSNFGALNATQQNFVRNFALSQFAAVANVTFSEITETATTHATLRFAKTDATDTAWGYYPASQGYGGDTWYRNSGGDYDNPVIGNYAGHTFLHEIGHAFGLEHGHDPANPFGKVPNAHDSVEYTIMTYRSYVGGPLDGYTYGNASAPQTLMQNDIAALQYLYGANYNTNSGNTVYSWNSSTGQTFINGVSMGAVAGNKIFMTLWDGGGVDTYDLSAYSTNLSINLQPGAWNTFSSTQLASLGSGHSAAGNVANALLYNNNTQSLIENAIGGSGNDTIVGNVANNDLKGGAGNDTLNGGGGNDLLEGGGGADNHDGGSGFDYACYTLATAGVWASLANPGINSGDAAGDSYISIEGLTGSAFNDVLFGNSGANDIVGGDGIDQLEGGAGADQLNGGVGFDYAIYYFATAGVTASLANPGINTGDAAGDSYISIEGLTGSVFNDVLTGDGGNNQLWGIDGDDTLDGGAGNDLIWGGNGNDTFVYSSGRDTIMDFVAGAGGIDVVDLRGVTGVQSLADVLARTTQVGAHTVIDFGGGNTLTLQNVTKTNLVSSDFLFSAPVSQVDLTTSGLALTGTRVSYTINNTGAAASAASAAGIYLSTDSTITGADTLLTSVATPSLAVGGAVVQGATLTFPTNLTPGTYYIGVLADYAGQVGESSESNNASNAVPVILGNTSANTLTGTAAADSIFGMGGNDTLNGGGGNDLLEGGGGADNHDGGSGFDYACYTLATAGVWASLANPGINAGDAAGDSYVSIEGLIGSAFNDVLFGNSGANELIGGDGIDQLEGGAGADRLDGGDSFDYAIYYFATAGVTASLANPGINTGDAAGDSYISIEGLTGSAFNDILIGDSGDNQLWGIDGDDTLDGGAGNDLIWGGNGNDTFVYSSGRDTIMDFVAGAGGIDVVDLRGVTGVQSLADVLARTTQVGAHTVIDFGGGNTLTLQNVTKTNLVSGDFLF